MSEESGFTDIKTGKPLTIEEVEMRLRAGASRRQKAETRNLIVLTVLFTLGAILSFQLMPLAKAADAWLFANTLFATNGLGLFSMILRIIPVMAAGLWIGWALILLSNRKKEVKS